MGRFRPLFVGRAPADDGPATDHGRPVRNRACFDNRLPHGVGIESVDFGHDVPAVRSEALRRVVRKPALDFAVDRDAIVIVKTDELAELERAGE